MTVQRPGAVKAGTAGANGQGSRGISNSAALRAKKAEEDFLARRKRQPTGAKCQADPTSEAARCRSRSAGVSAPTPARNAPKRRDCSNLPSASSQQPSASSSSSTAAPEHGKATLKTAKTASSRGGAVAKPKRSAAPKPDTSSSMASRPEEDNPSSANEPASSGPHSPAAENQHACQPSEGPEKMINENQPHQAEEETPSIAQEEGACQGACQAEGNPSSPAKEQQPEISQMPVTVQADEAEDADGAEQQPASLAEEQDLCRPGAACLSPTKVQGTLEELASPENLQMAEAQEDTVTIFPSTALPHGHASSSTLDGGLVDDTFQPKLAKVVEEAKACLSAEQQERPGGLLKEVLRRGTDHMMDSPELDTYKRSPPTSPQQVSSCVGAEADHVAHAGEGPVFEEEDLRLNRGIDFRSQPRQLLETPETDESHGGSKPHQSEPPRVKGGGCELQQALARQANKCLVLGAQGGGQEKDDGPEAASTIEHVATKGGCELQQALTRQAKKCINLGTQGGGQEDNPDKPETAPIVEDVASAPGKGGCELQQALARQAKKCIDLSAGGEVQEDKDDRPEAGPIIEHAESSAAKGGNELQQVLARQARKCIDLGTQGGGQEDADNEPRTMPITERAQTVATKEGCELRQALARQAKKCVDLGAQSGDQEGGDDEPQATPIIEHVEKIAKEESRELQQALARQATKCLDLGTQGGGQELKDDEPQAPPTTEQEAAPAIDHIASVLPNNSHPLVAETLFGHQGLAASERDASSGQAQNAGGETQQCSIPCKMENADAEPEVMRPEETQTQDDGRGQSAQVQEEDGSEMELDLQMECGELTTRLETKPLLTGDSLELHMVTVGAGSVTEVAGGSSRDDCRMEGPIRSPEQQHSSGTFRNQALEQTRSPCKEPRQREQTGAANESEMDLDMQTNEIHDIADSQPKPREADGGFLHQLDATAAHEPLEDAEGRCGNAEGELTDSEPQRHLSLHETETMANAQGSLEIKQSWEVRCKEDQMHEQDGKDNVLEHPAASTRPMSIGQSSVSESQQAGQNSAFVHLSLRGCQPDASGAEQQEQNETNEKDAPAQKICQHTVTEPQLTCQKLAVTHSRLDDDSSSERQCETQQKPLEDESVHADFIPSALASPVRSETSGSESQMLQHSQEETLELATLQARLCGARLGAARPSMLGVISEEHHVDGAAGGTTTAPPALPTGSLRRKAGSSTAQSSSEEDASAEISGLRAGSGPGDSHQVSGDFEDVSTIEAEETTFQIPDAFHRQSDERLTHEQTLKDSSEDNNSWTAIPAARQERRTSHAEDSKFQVQQSKQLRREQESFGEDGGIVRSSVSHGRHIDGSRSELQHSSSADARKTPLDSLQDTAEENSQELFKHTARPSPGERTSDASKVSAQRQPRQRQPRQRQKPPAVGGDDSSLPSEAEDQPKTELLLELAKQLEAVTSAKGGASRPRRDPQPMSAGECVEGTWMSLADASRAGIPIEQAAAARGGMLTSATQEIPAKELRREGCGARLLKSKWCYLGLALAGVGLLSFAVVEMAWQLGPEPEWFA